MPELTLVERKFLFSAESENIESFVSKLHFLDVIDTVDSEHALVNHRVEAGIRGHQQLLCNSESATASQRHCASTHIVNVVIVI